MNNENEVYQEKSHEEYVANTKHDTKYSDVGFVISDKKMDYYGIPLVPKLEKRERWNYVDIKTSSKKDYKKVICKRIADSKRYIISTYGRLYDTKTGKMVPTSRSNISSGKGEYLIYRLKTKGNKKSEIVVGIFVHRLMMSTFYPDEFKPNYLVNHIDGIPEHNYLWNLEWTTTSQNYIHALKNGLKKEMLGENRSNSKWTDNEIHMICKLMEDGHKATYIYNCLLEKMNHDPKVTYERVRTLYKHIKHRTHWAHISRNYKIDFSKNDYSKEEQSVKNATTKK